MAVDRERSRGGSWSILGTSEGEMETIWRGGCYRNECQDRDKSEWKGNGGWTTSKRELYCRIEQVTVHSFWHRDKWVALNDMSWWLWQGLRNGGIIWFKRASFSIAGLMCVGQSNMKHWGIFWYFQFLFICKCIVSMLFCTLNSTNLKYYFQVALINMFNSCFLSFLEKSIQRI